MGWSPRWLRRGRRQQSRLARSGTLADATRETALNQVESVTTKPPDLDAVHAACEKLGTSVQRAWILMTAVVGVGTLYASGSPLAVELARAAGLDAALIQLVLPFTGLYLAATGGYMLATYLRRRSLLFDAFFGETHDTDIKEEQKREFARRFNDYSLPFAISMLVVQPGMQHRSEWEENHRSVKILTSGPNYIVLFYMIIIHATTSAFAVYYAHKLSTGWNVTLSAIWTVSFWIVVPMFYLQFMATMWDQLKRFWIAFTFAVLLMMSIASALTVIDPV